MPSIVAPSWKIADQALDLSAPLAIGIVNVTEDSMFEGARSGTPEAAVAAGRGLVEQGFDMLDVGAVAARSGPPVPAAEEAQKLVPAIAGLADAGVPISADTFSAEVARSALDAGAVAINDISGAADPELLELAAERGCGLVLMHIEGPPRVDRAPVGERDPIERLLEFFGERLGEAAARGVDSEQIAIDPGLDFDLTLEDDLEILARLPELFALRRPVFMALSRKDFLGAVIAGSWDGRAPAGEREWASVAATALAARSGVRLHRLHDASSVQALRVAHAVTGGAK